MTQAAFEFAPAAETPVSCAPTAEAPDVIRGAARWADVPPYTCGGVTFRCIAIDEDRYEWRSADGRVVAGRVPGSSLCWASVQGRSLGRSFPSLRSAMITATGGRFA